MTTPLDRLADALASRYRVERELGLGGMATVYLAHDLRNNRKVALKVLRPELAAILGAERFLKEIETTANLQHPHILPLFDSGRTGGDERTGDFLYYVMPFVEGESLRDRLNRDKQLSIADAVRIATEVASALDYAHRHGVLHRDIKPENILLHDGQALVADFGIALAVSRSDAGSRMTETGMSLGTPHYMAPEQAMGEREISPRADIYALGCVLYEMLIGEPPFTGPTAQAIIARVMTEEPRSLVLQRRTIPPELEATVVTALAKLPADRFATAAELAEALAGRRPGGVTRSTGYAAAAARSSPRLAVVPIAAGVLGLLLAFFGGWLSARRSGSGPVPFRLSINLSADQQLASVEPIATLSPDGAELVFSGRGTGGVTRLYSRRIDQLIPVPIAGTDGGCCPAFSPDGTAILFFEGTTLRRVPRGGGAATTIPAPADARITSARWAGADAFIVTLLDGSLAALGADGALRPIARPDSARRESSLDVMQVLPGGAALVIAVTDFPGGPLLAIDPGTGRRNVVSGAALQWADYADGYLAWVGSDNLLYASRFDPARLRTTGTVLALGAAPQITRGLRPKVALSAGGALAYVPAQPLSLVTVDRTGRSTTLLDQPRSYHSPRVSPDGRRILFDFQESGRDVWQFDLRDTTLTRVTFENSGHDPTWLPDGRLVFAAVHGTRIGIFRRNVDGSGVAESVLVTGTQVTAHTVTPDGRTAIAAEFSGGSTASDFNLLRVPLDGTGKPETLLGTRYFEGYPALSPDGRWLAYVSDETNRQEVYVRPLQGGGSKILVSQSGGTEPVWARDGRTLFYRSFGPREQQLIAAAVEARAEFRVLSRAVLFDVVEYEAAIPHANYDVMPDGKSFVMVRMGRLAEFVYLRRWSEGE